MSPLEPPPEGTDTWLALSGEALPVGAVPDWLVGPECGAMVQFTGTARSTSGGRTDVELLTYEAYETEAVRRLEAVVDEIRMRWPDVVRIAILHRTGDVVLGGAAVHVGVSAPHRDAAFEAARFGIDALKASVPIWKRELHGDGETWGPDGSELSAASEVVPERASAAGSSANGGPCAEEGLGERSEERLGEGSTPSAPGPTS
ncbi:MAG: molybdenum cofactor biosynthesis protein MoaE [Microthrixaceae bacterium]|nr:molybdenum cofactor biosynthesis protein MoaE [Microthrixaceae bacterium]